MNSRTISEYAKETAEMEKRFEELASKKDESMAIDLLNLFDAIENRLGDLRMWKEAGLTEDDEIPKSPTKLIPISWRTNEEAQEK